MTFSCLSHGSHVSRHGTAHGGTNFHAIGFFCLPFFVSFCTFGGLLGPLGGCWTLDFSESPTEPPRGGGLDLGPVRKSK